MRAAVILRESGVIEDLDLDTVLPPEENPYGFSPVLANLQKAVKGDVQCIVLDESFEMWLNEEGKIRPELGLFPNPIATVLLRRAGGMPGDIVMGPVVLTPGVDREGETVGLEEATRRRLLDLLSDVKKEMPGG